MSKVDTITRKPPRIEEAASAYLQGKITLAEYMQYDIRQLRDLADAGQLKEYQPLEDKQE